ncbi:MAG: 16S rRNA (adenine(1518)-N(6)/adenine(1519)-N(6))-dimethyltransferase RsmA [Pseudoflavonifractor sp.]
MDLCNVNDIKDLLGRHGFRFSKSMGQNFLIEGWVPHDIAASSGADRSCGVLEIGPGIGPLTAELAQLAGKVVAVELDRSLLPVLKETLADHENVEIVPGDVLKLDIPGLIADKLNGFTPIACANLPYNITSPLLAALIDADCFASITVMIQREVALRICAAPGTADYGAFSVYCQYHTDPQILFDVSPDCFLPAPKVTSSVLHMVPRSAPPAEVADKKLFFQVVKASFAQRRKTLLNGLTSAFGSSFTKEALGQIIADCGLPADIRGERLGIPEFAALAAELKKRNPQNS